MTFLGGRAPCILGLLTAICFCQADTLPRRGTLGVQLRAAPAEVREKLKLGPQEALQVVAAANGLQANDLIVAVAGKRFKSFADYNEMLRSFTATPSAHLTVLRDGKEVDADVAIQPKKPDNTDTYETIYDEVLSTGHRIRTFVTKPKNPGKYPVFFYFQGINTGSIDFPLSGTSYIAKVLKQFADDFVTVRVEKTGVGDSEGGPAKLVGYGEELDIYRQALKSLAKYDFIDQDNIFVFGHSMGGCHAPLVAGEIPIRGIITYGTVANSWLEWELRNPRISEPLAGKTSAEVDTEVRQLTSFYGYLYNEKKTIDWIKQNRPDLKAMAEDASPDGVMLGDRTIVYMQELNDHNFCDAWAKIPANTKVLALFGENDWISNREDQTQVADTVNAALKGNAEFKIVPNSDHLFNKCTSMQDSFNRFGKPGSEFNPEVVRIMKDWIAQVLKR